MTGFWQGFGVPLEHAQWPQERRNTRGMLRTCHVKKAGEYALQHVKAFNWSELAARFESVYGG